MIYAFGNFELDEERAELRRTGERVALQPKSFALLLHLLRNRDRVVGRAELLEVVWSGENVVRSALTRAVQRVRRALDDDPNHPRLVITQRGRGYRFAAQVEERAHATAKTDAPARHERPPGPRSSDPFVGRIEVLARLEESLDGVIRGRGRFILMSGEAGIGKTRTIAEVVGRARRINVECLIGRSFEGEGAPPFWPWTRMLRDFARDRSPASLREALGPGASEIAEAMPELRSALPEELPPPPPIESEQARFRLFDAVTSFLRRASRTRPLLLVLDDLHWADVDSLRLLHFAARELVDACVMLVGLRRSAFALDPERAAVVDALAREHAANCVDLEGLSEDETRDLVVQLVDQTPPVELVPELHDRSAGNPLFLRSLFAGLERGRLTGTEWQLPAADGMHDAIERRLEPVGKDARFALGWAAVVGRHFAASPVAEACGLALEHLSRSFDEAVAGGVIDAEEAPGKYRFVHGLIQEVLYAQLTPTQRAERHAAIARAIERQLGAEVGPHLGDLALHYRRGAVAGEAQRAVRACRRAAEDAHARQAHSDAARYWQWALDALDLADNEPEQRAALCLSAGEALQLSGAYEAARSHFRSAAETARSLGNTALLTRAALGLRAAAESGEVDAERIALLEEALSLDLDSVPQERVELLAALAEATYFRDGEARAQPLAAEAVRLAHVVADPATLGRALNAHHTTLQQLASADERSQLSRELEQVAERAGDPELLARAYVARIQDAHETSNREALERYLAKHRSVAERIRQPRVLWQSLLHQAMLTLLTGPLTEAEPAIQRALEAGQRIHFDLAFQWAGVQVAVLRREQGRFAETEPSVEHLAKSYPSIATWRAVLALIEAETQREEDAQRRLSALTRDGLAGVGNDVNEGITLAVLAEVACLLRDRDAGERIYETLLPFAAKQIVVAMEIANYGCASRFLGMLAQLLARREDAITHFEEAIRLDGALGAAPFVARGRFELARCLREDTRGYDEQRAASLLVAAQDAARSLDMPRLTSDIATLESD